MGVGCRWRPPLLTGEAVCLIFPPPAKAAIILFTPLRFLVAIYGDCHHAHRPSSLGGGKGEEVRYQETPIYPPCVLYCHYSPPLPSAATPLFYSFHAGPSTSIHRGVDPWTRSP
jgi:hypothetical protein